MSLPRWTDNFIEGVLQDLYRLRPPWRGQDLAHYDFVEPAQAGDTEQVA